jgi:hypothetical protein
MANGNGKNLPKPMSCKASFVYDIGTGERSKPATRIIKGGDLRARKSNNNGK